MSMGILGTALSGLAAYQQALSTASNNISNANTPGYSVEKVQFATQAEQYTGAGYVGNGVSVTNIARSYNQFLNAQVLAGTSAYNGSNSLYTNASQIDNLLADQKTGLSSSISTFFNDVNTVSNNPTSLPSRQVMLTDANSLASQFNNLTTTFDSLRSQVNSTLTSSVNQLNTYAQTLAQLNGQIVAASNNATGITPNGLLDQRDNVLNQLSQLANVSVVNQTNGSISVFVGQGQPLVLDNTASSLSLQASATDSTHMQVMLNGQDISQQFSGGQIAGNIQFRDQVLDPAQAQLGLLATGLSTAVNNVQTAGFDLSGNQGLPIFNLGSPSVQVNGQYADPTLTVSAAFVQPTAANIPGLAASYQLQVTSGGGGPVFSLTNLTDNTTVAGLSSATLATAAAADGFSINFPTGALNTGDTFKISPNFNAGMTIQVNPALTPSGIAAAGAAGAPGDNSNAIAMANLQTQTLMTNGTSTFSQVYGQLVSGVGASTSSAQLNSNAQNTALQNATAAQQSLSGVNINEEAANLIQYQNAYQAAAKTVSVAQTLFSAMLNAVS